MKIGIFGGTFNPPHAGHVIVAEHVRTALRLEKVLFIPSYLSPHKLESESDLAEHRLAMTRLAIRENDHFDISDIEVKQKGISYTIQTLESLTKENPTASFSVIVGMDNYLTFHRWKEPRRILALSTLVVMNRPGFPRQMNEQVGSENVLFVDVPNIDISSSEIRRRVALGASIRSLVDPEVEEYISRHSLYRSFSS